MSEQEKQSPGLGLTISLFVILSIVISLLSLGIHHEYEHDVEVVQQPQQPVYEMPIQVHMDCLNRDGNNVLVHFVVSIPDNKTFYDKANSCFITLTPEDELTETIQEQIKIAREKE